MGEEVGHTACVRAIFQPWSSNFRTCVSGVHRFIVTAGAMQAGALCCGTRVHFPATSAAFSDVLERIKDPQVVRKFPVMHTESKRENSRQHMLSSIPSSRLSQAQHSVSRGAQANKSNII